jgi:hypothetical protein
MRADVFIDRTEGDGVEISVVKHGSKLWRRAQVQHGRESQSRARQVRIFPGTD